MQDIKTGRNPIINCWDSYYKSPALQFSLCTHIGAKQIIVRDPDADRKKKFAEAVGLYS